MASNKVCADCRDGRHGDCPGRCAGTTRGYGRKGQSLPVWVRTYRCPCDHAGKVTA